MAKIPLTQRKLFVIPAIALNAILILLLAGLFVLQPDRPLAYLVIPVLTHVSVCATLLVFLCRNCGDGA